MNERPTITGVTGTPLPNLKALNFKWRPEQELVEEQGRLRDRARELGMEQVRLEDEIKRLKQERVSRRADALRTGEAEPEGDPVGEAQDRLAEVSEELEAVRLAGQRSYGEMLKKVQELAPERIPGVQAAGEKVLARAQEHADALAVALREAEVLGAVHGFYESGGQRFGIPGGAGVSIEALVHERKRALGLVEPGVVGVVG